MPNVAGAIVARIEAVFDQGFFVSIQLILVDAKNQ
jgi:hypothetical protein